MLSFTSRVIPHFGILLFIAAMPVLAAENEYIRVKEDEKSAQLQTAVTQFKKEKVTVDLIGAIHIADAQYYQLLNERFKKYDRLLFEMIGGEALGKKDVEVERPEGAVKQDLSLLTRAYNVSADFLQLVGQMDAVDYKAKNFVHADLTLAEFRQLQQVRQESLLSFMLEAGIKAPKPEKEPNSMRLLVSILKKDANAVKLELVHVLGQGDEQIGAMDGENVVLTDRNKRCLDVLRREAAAGHHKIGIFYGAAHFPDMVKRLEAMGYQQVGQEWMTAWDVPKTIE